MHYLMEAGSVFGNFFIVWVLLQKKNDSEQFIYEQCDIIEQCGGRFVGMWWILKMTILTKME